MVDFLKSKGFTAGYWVMIVGVAVLVSGFGIDAWLHARDPNLAAEEGIFTLSNPGHLLIVIGLTVTVIGAVIGPYSRWILTRPSPILPVVVPVAALAIALTGSTAFALTVNSLSHDNSHMHGDLVLATDGPHGVVPGDDPAHDTAGDAGVHADHAARILPENRELHALEESTFHEPAQTQPVTRENLEFAEQFLVDARAETEKYQDVNAAVADGFFQITQDLPLIGAHFFKPSNVGSLDPGRPGILLYEEDGDGGWSLVGMAYMLLKQDGASEQPVTPFGGLVKWHYHTDLCFGPGVVSVAASQAECAGQYVSETPWLLHVWAWKDSPEGVFDHANSLLQ